MGAARWQASEHVEIWKNSTHRAYVYEGGNDRVGLLFLAMGNGNLGETETVLAGHRNPLWGWKFTLSQRDYEEWKARAERL